MQKFINVLAVASFAVSAAVVGAGVYVYLNQDAIIDELEAQAADIIGDAVGGAVGDLPSLLGGPKEQAPSNLPMPGSSAGVGLPMPF
jgi:hypothetical protein